MAGFFLWAPSERFAGSDPRPTARLLCDKLRRRGPDGHGWLVYPSSPGEAPATDRDERALPAFRLLMGQTGRSARTGQPCAVDGEGGGGTGPFRSADGRYAVVFDGRILNAPELRAELRAAGVEPENDGDAALALAAHSRWGEEAQRRFAGAFAFAIFDSGEGRLYCSCDHFGVKPLYWHHGAGGLAVASEMPALLEIPSVPRRVDRQKAYYFLVLKLLSQSDWTLVEGVGRMAPAYRFACRVPVDAAPKPECYWKIDLSRKSAISYPDAAEAQREMLLANVKVFTRDLEGAAFTLSGGIDSSALVCSYRRLFPEAPIDTYSYRAGVAGIDESRYANIVNESVRATAHLVDESSTGMVEWLDTMLNIVGEPMYSLSFSPFMRILTAMRDAGVSAAVSGWSADTMYGGDSGYTAERAYSLLCAGSPLAAWRFINKSARCAGLLSRGYILANTVKFLMPEWLVPFGRRLTGREAYPAWLDADAVRGAGLRLIPEDFRDELFPSKDKLRQALAYRLMRGNLDLYPMERLSTHFGVECRLPYLSTSIAELSMSLPEEYILAEDGTSKALFRAALRGLVPDPILDRKDKLAFNAPENDWLLENKGWVDSILDSKVDVPLLRMDRVRAMWDDFHATRKPFGTLVSRWIGYVRWAQLFKME